jgi:hypothetical protein
MNSRLSIRFLLATALGVGLVLSNQLPYAASVSAPADLNLTIGAASAGTITKTFEFGEGTPNSHSNVRTLPVPCGLDVIATVKFKRSGPAGAGNDVPIKIDLRAPDIGADEEGPVAATKNVTARRNEQTETLTGIASLRGCSLPWRVRVGYANAGTAPLAVSGSITVEYDDRGKNKSTRLSQDGKLGRNQNKTIDLDGEYFHQGIVEIYANWNHFVAGLGDGPLSVKLKFELIDPIGRVVASNTGYSTNDFNPLCLGCKPVRIVYRVPECQQGTWHVRITNDTVDDVHKLVVFNSLQPTCP